MIVAFLPAKGHSSRLRGKNMKQFCGKPLLEWTLIQCKYSQVDKTFVSTDDWSIARLCEEYGAEVYWRTHKEESEGDASGSIPIQFLMQHIFAECPDMDIGLSMFCTSPLRRPWDIDHCVDLCRETGRPTAVYIPRYETFIYQVEGDKVMPVIQNKNFKYADELAGLNVMPRTSLDATYTVEKLPDLSENRPMELDVGSMTDRMKPIGDTMEILNWYNEDNPSKAEVWKERFIKGEHWQAVEIDYLEDFELAEYNMKKYILKDGEDVYERYWKDRKTT